MDRLLSRVLFSATDQNGPSDVLEMEVRDSFFLQSVRQEDGVRETGVEGGDRNLCERERERPRETTYTAGDSREI